VNPSWLKFIPAGLRARIEHRPHLLKAMSNTGWLLGGNVVRMAVGLLVSVWLARYLGPEEFGLLNYAIAFAALFTAVASFGLNNVVVRDLVNSPKDASTILGTTFVLQFAGGLMAFGLAATSIFFIRPNDDLAKLMVSILAFAMVFKSADVVKYWFESQVQSKYSVWVEHGTYLAFAGVKVMLILQQASLMMFVWVIFAETVVVAFALLAVYAWRGGSIKFWRVRCARARTLLEDSWPLILSGLAVMIYMRIDQIMLGQMLGDEAVGLYSAAVGISEVWYFIPVAVAASVFPAIVEAKKQSEALYYQRLQKLYDWMTLLAIAVAILMTLLADWLMAWLYGESYRGAGSVLALHVWTGLFASMGVVSGRWYLVEGLQKLLFARTLAGAFINILANLLFIPEWGVQGAAIGTLLSQIAAAYVFDFFNLRTRPVFWMKSKSLLPLSLWRFKL
jgi:O-antigen/teichoic acid export membrane protein